MRVACFLKQETYKPGSQAPEGYLEWQEWADAQHKAGLRQVECGRCGKWQFPQQLSGKTDRHMVMRGRKRDPVEVVSHVCNQCAAKTPRTGE